MKRLTFIIFLTFLINNSFAATKAGINFKDNLVINQKKLQLNGLGIRKATWLKIKVYVGGLYLEEKSNNPNKFLNSNQVKFIKMKFVRDVSAKQLRDGWSEAFNNSVKDLSKIQKNVDQLNSYMTDLNSGEEMSFTFLKDKVEVLIKGQKKLPIEGAEFSRAMLSVWFINAKDQGLKEGLLGKN